MEYLQTLSDEELLKGCLEKDRKYQEQLYRKYSRKMYAICQGYARDKDMAQDILQDSFVKVFLKISTFEKGNSLEGWIRRVVTNTAIDYFRQSRKLNNFIELEEAHSERLSDDSINKAINVEEILYFLRKLPEGARIIFNLYAIEGYTHKEIADRLSISEGTSKSQYSRAKSILQGYLTGMAG
ncbi:sigma-70 family RNA polymerase sigma factor [Flammeovirgaceae bacterium 311]|nr:sigma-70 family RNA polymerase sigma factor [Flammeovirgaceae bacterium 311]